MPTPHFLPRGLWGIPWGCGVFFPFSAPGGAKPWGRGGGGWGWGREGVPPRVGRVLQVQPPAEFPPAFPALPVAALTPGLKNAEDCWWGS